ncbi:hypothetical protein WA026_010223 [Henosepilachna vigintioctopunctata]|uniref:Uncharacterized protein n=1 Tax=Henosepilachna vigintioctopunctata TaxID=420089 RepID=A0AAW1UIK9_9CUCU
MPTAAVTLKEESFRRKEISYVANYVNNDVLKRWEEMKSSTEQRWIEVFKHFKDSGIPFQNLPGYRPVPTFFARNKRSYGTSFFLNEQLMDIRKVVTISRNIRCNANYKIQYGQL